MKNKKILSVIAAFSAAATILSTTAYAVYSYTSEDAEHLRDVIFGVAKGKTADDINEDGIIDAFDMIALRESLSSKGEFTTENYSATQENVKLVGRTYSSNDITWLVQSGSAAEFTLTGKSAEITLAGDSSINNGEDYRSRYAVYVDGDLLIDSTMSTSEKKITLFSSDASRSVKVKVIHLSEAMNGAVGIRNISVLTDSVSPIKPAAKKDISIEFIGDSITCAYGVEGLSSYESFKTTTENFMKSYAYLTAEKLNADYSAVCYSGHGIISGYTSSGDRNTDSLIPDCYGLAGKLSNYAHSWDFSASTNDVVVINLGTNDSGYVNADPENRSSEFIDGYVDFLKTVREKNPQAYIVCTLGTMGCEDIYELVEDAVEEYSNATGDKRVMSYKSATQNPADGIGSDWHPSVLTQQNSAYVLADKICQVLGIESDQVGLDVAADGVYDLKIDSAMGGNAAFFVGYDKSFWVNMVMGGTSPQAIEATVSGINLKKDGVYRLEFDYTSTVDAEVPILVRGTSKTVYNDEVSAVAEKKHYSEEFKVTESDEAEIVFQLGGMDYYNVTLSNIKLVKVS